MKVIWVVAALVAVTVFGSTEAKWKKRSCNNNITISDTDCNKYLAVANSEEGYEEGSLQLPVPNKLRGWRLVIGFSEELTSFSLPDARSRKKMNKCGGRLFAFSNGRIKKNVWKSLKIDYDAEFSKELSKRPVVSFIYFGDKRCSQKCGKKPICPTKAPRTRPQRTGSKRPRTRPQPTGSKRPRTRPQPTGSKRPRTRPQPTGSKPPGSRPRPTGSKPPGSRPRPTGSKPPGTRPRPTGSKPPGTRPRPTGSKPSGTRPQPTSSKPPGTRPRPTGSKPPGTRQPTDEPDTTDEPDATDELEDEDHDMGSADKEEENDRESAFDEEENDMESAFDEEEKEVESENAEINNYFQAF